MGWLAVRVRPGRRGAASDRVAVSGALFGLGAQAVQEIDDALATQFPESVGADAITAAIRDASETAIIEIVDAPAVDWAERWRDAITVHPLGRLTIAPPWLASGLDPATSIIIEPEMAFGTGEHATTRGVVRLLPDVVRLGARVADLGAGSAVLAIAAAKLGAGRVAAIELDPDAIGNAEANVRRNDVAAFVTVIEGDAALLLPLVAPVDVITANIISSVLIALLPIMSKALAPGGRAIISGILAQEREEMIDALGAGGWRVMAEDAEDIWWSATIARS
jgi:ribosomal protein L11 methyltransferase